MYCICTLTQGENRRTHTIIVCTLINSVLLPLPNYYPEDRVRRDGTIALRVGTRFKIFILTPGRHKRSITHSFTGITLACAIMCCCPLGGSIPGAPNRASGEALGVGGRRRRQAGVTPAGRGPLNY